MNYLHEIIKFDENFPIKLFTQSIDQFDMHWHTEIELILIIEGSINIGVGKKIHLLKQNEFILINSTELHNFSATNETNLLLILQFNTKYYFSLYPKLNKMVFDCNSSLNTIANQEKCDLVRYHIAKIVLELNKKSNGYQLVIASEVHLLLRDIIQNFDYTLINSRNIPTNEMALLKVQNILEFINKNFTRKISLQEIAQQEKYSSTYMSRFIKKNLGMSFYDYLQRVRMHKACNLMIYSSASLTEIAYLCGFPNYKSFYLLSKKICGCTPEEYRNGITSEINESQINTIQPEFTSQSYLYLDKKTALKKLFDFFEPWNYTILRKHDLLDSSHELITINAQCQSYSHSWNKLTTFSQASDCLKREFQNQLDDLQSSSWF